MKRTSILLAALAIILAGCSKDEAVESPTHFVKGQKVTLTASTALNNAAVTRVKGTFNTVTNEIDFVWQEGDKLTITVGTESSIFTLKSGAGTANATFEGEMPASGDKFTASRGSKDIPETQTYDPSSPIPVNSMFFEAKECTIGNVIELKPKSSLLILSFYNDGQPTVEQIIVYSITGSETEVIATLKYEGGISISNDPSNPTPFYIIVPQGTFNIRVNINNGISFPDSGTTNMTFEEGKFLNMPLKALCLAAGTKITTADGSVKNIEDIVEGDMVLTFDHEAGCLSAAPICLVYKGDMKSTPLNLTFESGQMVSFVGSHDLLLEDTRKYVPINSANVVSYVGKRFYNMETRSWDSLIDYNMGAEPVDYYCIYSAYHLNCVANGMLTLPDDVDFLMNIYELDANLKADSVQLAADIAKYGLLDVAEVLPEYIQFKDLMEALLFKYGYIAIGKGLFTKEEFRRSSFWNEMAAGGRR